MEETPKRKMSYENALVLAKANVAGWIDIQIQTLENHLTTMATRNLEGSEKDVFYNLLNRLKRYDLNSLTMLGNEYHLLADYDLQTESLKIFCERNGIKIED